MVSFLLIFARKPVHSKLSMPTAFPLIIAQRGKFASKDLE